MRVKNFHVHIYSKYLLKNIGHVNLLVNSTLGNL